MKNTILSAVIALGILGAQAASASCKSDFAFLHDKNKMSLTPVRTVELRQRVDFFDLRSPELKAARDYMKYLSFKLDGSNSLVVRSSLYKTKADQSPYGYKIIVTDGKDESPVTYYIKIGVGIEDVGYLILFRSAPTQNPAYDFLCETL